MKTTVTLVIFEPFVKTMFMKLMATFALYDFACYWGVSTLYAMWTDSLQLIFTNWTCLTLWITNPTCYSIPLYYLKNFGVLFLHPSQFNLPLFLALNIDLSIKNYKRYRSIFINKINQILSYTRFIFTCMCKLSKIFIFHLSQHCHQFYFISCYFFMKVSSSDWTDK